MVESGATSTVNDRLAALRDRFRVRAEMELDSLEKQAAGFGAGEKAGQEELAEIARRLHQLAGSAGTFGQPALGEAARVLEKRLLPDADGPTQQPADLLLRVSELKHLLQRAPITVGDSASETSSESPLGSHGARVQVVLVLDDAAESRSLSDALGGYGFESHRYSVADDKLAGCLAKLVEQPRAILCSDARLMSVMALLRANAEPSVERVPVVCLSPDTSFANRYQAASLGAVAFFGQPVDVPELAERIEYLAIERSAHVRGRVLMVEDDQELAEHYRLILTSAGVDVCWVREPTELMHQLSEFRPDIILMDVQLGEYSGVHLARLVRFDPQWLSLPIIYLSSEADRDVQLDALSRGADEFLTKPVSDGYLVRSVLIRCFRARQLSGLMNRDSLTGLLKHSLIKQEADKELSRCRREGLEACVVMLDIDHFKQVNDIHGHRCGDTVIKALANLLRNRLRETDRIGRYGGEEFLLVLPGCGKQDARQRMADLRASFSGLVFKCGGDSFRVTLSAGIAQVNAFECGSDAIEAADQALYQAKREGRDREVVFEGREPTDNPVIR